MSKAQQTLAQAFLERISRGAVPMGGFYWVDPKALRSQVTNAEATAARAAMPAPTVRRASETIDAGAPKTLPASATALQASTPGLRSATAGQASATAGRVSAMASPTSGMPWRRAAVVRRSAELAQRIGLFLIGAHPSSREPSETVSTGCTQHAPGGRS